MNVKELSPEQLNELRFNLYYCNEDDFEDFEEFRKFAMIVDIRNITNEMIFEHYKGISFVNDDFVCTMDNEG